MTVRRPTITAAMAVLLLAAASPAAAQDDDLDDAVQRGRELAVLLCQRCHDIAGPGPSPNRLAPPFPTLIERLTMEGVADEIQEGLALGHEPMPPWTFSPQQVEDLLSYLYSISPE